MYGMFTESVPHLLQLVLVQVQISVLDELPQLGVSQYGQRSLTDVALHRNQLLQSLANKEAETSPSTAQASSPSSLTPARMHSSRVRIQVFLTSFL